MALGRLVLLLLLLLLLPLLPSKTVTDLRKQFHADAWALLDSPAGGLGWAKLKDVDGGEKSEARGWFAAARWGSKVVVHGGLNERNARLDDMWTLEVVRE